MDETYPTKEDCVREITLSERLVRQKEELLRRIGQIDVALKMIEDNPGIEKKIVTVTRAAGL